MEKGAKCRRCLLREAYPADYEKYVASVLARMERGRRADDEIYARRLETCRACGQLSNGTCMGCGCLVEIRAAVKGERCPFRKW